MATRSKRISRGTVSERVSNAIVASIVVTPDEAPNEVVTLLTQQFTAVAKDTYGVTIAMPTGAIAWTRLPAGAGDPTISATGLLTAGVNLGEFTVTATHTASAAADTVDVEVIAA